MTLLTVAVIFDVLVWPLGLLVVCRSYERQIQAQTDRAARLRRVS